jgi:SAM-dependent methyltransferase
MAQTDFAAWENAEVVRSGVEASLTSSESLRIGPRTRARYLAPPADTAYPLEYAYHLLGDVRGKDVLDLGCGNGGNTALLALRGARVCGLDISPELIDLARVRLAMNGIAGDVRFLVGSAHEIDLPDASVDVVFGIAILHHLDLKKTAAEAHRVLRPGGRAIFQEPVRNSPTIRAIRRLIPYHAPDVSPYERPLTREELAQFAQPFRSVRSRAFVLPHVALAQVLPGMRRHVGPAYRLDRALLRFKPLEYYAGARVFEVVK